MSDKQAKKLRITLKRSTIGYHKKQKLTVKTLGLHKLHQTVEHNDTPQIRGMVNKIRHLVEVVEMN